MNRCTFENVAIATAKDQLWHINTNSSMFVWSCSTKYLHFWTMLFFPFNAHKHDFRFISKEETPKDSPWNEHTHTKDAGTILSVCSWKQQVLTVTTSWISTKAHVHAGANSHKRRMKLLQSRFSLQASQLMQGFPSSFKLKSTLKFTFFVAFPPKRTKKNL